MDNGAVKDCGAASHIILLSNIQYSSMIPSAVGKESSSDIQ